MAEGTGIKENWKPLSTCYFCPSPKMWRQKNIKSKGKKEGASQKYG